MAGPAHWREAQRPCPADACVQEVDPASALYRFAELSRIFSRSAEQFILRGLVDFASTLGAVRPLGEFRPTAKNAVVTGLYPSLGFVAAGDGFSRAR